MSADDDFLPPAPRRPRLLVSFDEEQAPAAGDAPAQAPARPRLVVAPDPLPPAPPPVAAPRPPRPPSPASDVRQPAYTICTIREVIDPPPGPEHGLIFPVPSLQRDEVVREARDGRSVSTVIGKDVEVCEGSARNRLLKAPDIRVRIDITDARVTFACSKYDKGGGWIGDPVSMLALNTGSKLLAAARRRGKMLVGQVRYPWIVAVYAQNKTWKHAEVLRLRCKSGDEYIWVDLELKGHDATVVAREIIHRAARFRLAHDPELSLEEQRELHELARLPPLVWRKEDGQMVGAEFSTFWPAGAHSAHFGA